MRNLKNGYKKNVAKENSGLTIINEDNEIITYEQLIQLIDSKQVDPFNYENPDNFLYCDNVGGYIFSNDDFC